MGGQEASMAERMYVLGDDGSLQQISEEPYESEDALQELIARFPDVLAGEQMSPKNPRRWLLVRREMGIADGEGAGDRWSVDHLFLDQDGVPTLVEVKRSTDSRIRREVVGQMLDYAAHASRYWPAERLRSTVEAAAEAAGERPADRIARAFGHDPQSFDIDAFWSDVSRNLRAGQLRLLFVADEIPDELQHIVEFLNAQMPNVEVLAVELKQFRGTGLRTLVPRVLGRTAKQVSPGPTRSPATRESLLAAMPDNAARIAAARLIDVAKAANALFEYGAQGVSIRARCRLWAQPVTVAWIFPPGPSGGWMRTHDFSFGSGIISESDLPEVVSEILHRYFAQFRESGVGDDASSSGVEAWALSPAEAAAETEVLADRLTAVLGALARL